MWMQWLSRRFLQCLLALALAVAVLSSPLPAEDDRALAYDEMPMLSDFYDNAVFDMEKRGLLRLGKRSPLRLGKRSVLRLG
ncbi:unnamed protein product, partial [Mesorhabditis spiculigera]